MRFLMKTFVVRPAPRLIHALRQNPLWMRSGSRCCLLVLYQTRSGHPGVTGAAQLQLSIFWHQFDPVSGKLLLGQHPKSLIALVCTPSRWVLSHTLSNVRGRLRPTVE